MTITFAFGYLYTLLILRKIVEAGLAAFNKLPHVRKQKKVD
jgi:hypothetical protein